MHTTRYVYIHMKIKLLMDAKKRADVMCLIRPKEKRRERDGLDAHRR